MECKLMCRTMLLNLNQLRLNKELCDVQLIVQNANIPAHRVILAANSPYFKKLIMDDQQSKVNVFLMNGIEKFVMLHILDFLYTGQLQLKPGNITMYSGIAKQLDIPVLARHCELFRENASSRKTGGNVAVQNAPVARVQVSPLRKRKSEQSGRILGHSQELLDVYRPQGTQEFHNYCVQKDLMDISNKNVYKSGIGSARQNNAASTVTSGAAFREDLSVCCELDNEEKSKDDTAEFGACSDGCCTENKFVKQEINDETVTEKIAVPDTSSLFVRDHDLAKDSNSKGQKFERLRGSAVKMEPNLTETEETGNHGLSLLHQMHIPWNSMLQESETEVKLKSETQMNLEQWNHESNIRTFPGRGTVKDQLLETHAERSMLFNETDIPLNLSKQKTDKSNTDSSFEKETCHRKESMEMEYMRFNLGTAVGTGKDMLGPRLGPRLGQRLAHLGEHGNNMFAHGDKEQHLISKRQPHDS